MRSPHWKPRRGATSPAWLSATATTTQLVERLAILAERYVVAHLLPTGRDARAQREHREILAAWLARDEPGVETLLAHHLRATLEDLHAQFAGRR